MNDTEKAIGTINQMQSMYNHIRHNDDEFLALDAAKEALREKQEREQGCEVCENVSCTNCMWQRMCKDDSHDGRCNSSSWKYEPRNYCGYCGRKLRPEGSGEE